MSAKFDELKYGGIKNNTRRPVKSQEYKEELLYKTRRYLDGLIELKDNEHDGIVLAIHGILDLIEKVM